MDKAARELIKLAKELMSSSDELKRLQQMYDFGIIDQDEYEKKKAEIESSNQSGYSSQHELVNDLKSSGWKTSGGGRYADMLYKTIAEMHVSVYSTFLDPKKFSIWIYPSRAMYRTYGDGLADKPEFKKLSNQEFSINKVRSPEGLESLAKDMIKKLKDKFPTKRKQTEYANLEYEGKTGEDALKEWRKDVESMIVDFVESSYDVYMKERTEAERHDAKSGDYGKDSLAHYVWNRLTGGWVSLKEILYETLELGGKASRIRGAMDDADINPEKEVKKVVDMLVRKKRIIDESGRQLSFANMTYYSIKRRFE